MMFRLRQPPSLWAALAVLAIGLLLLAPLISRCQQAPSGEVALHGQALCTSSGLRLPGLAGSALPVQAGHHDDAGLAHAPLCDYCLLAARLLPWMVLLLVLLPWRGTSAPDASVCSVFATADLGRAHPARGPPLFY
ncbi:DUF2946 domain-containing protein [Xanthomonas albilineans]|uniref:DUF2946 domain-containing protein n=1 Tax=Xanthomonas albilineans TaxID=29447 RepID=UPI000B2F5F9E|nr:DUF2946 domain-containing protein [Xanthomonas albilineans]